nr:phospholipase-like protein [Tanacetum cinerariifolium]
LEVVFMGTKLVDEVPDTLIPLVENLEDSTVNLDLTPTKLKHQSDWCDTTSVEEIRVKDCVISQLNSRVYKLGTIIKTSFIDKRLAENGLDYDEDLVVKQEEEEKCHMEEFKMKKALFLSSLKEEIRVREDFFFLLKCEEEKKKWRHDLMNSDHWKVSRSKITNGKRSQRYGASLAYYWGDTFIHVEKDRPLNALNDQDMTQFLKDLTPWVEELSRYNKAPDRVHLTGAFDIFLGRQGPLRASFPWYNVAWSDVDQAMLPKVLMEGKNFNQKGIDHTTYNITFANAVKVPKQAEVFGDYGIWAMPHGHYVGI